MSEMTSLKPSDRFASVPLWRRLIAEFLGTGPLVTVVVGSGIAAEQLSPGDIGLELLENSFATALGLAVLIVMLGPISGAHFNPIVSTGGHLVGEVVATAGLILLIFALARTRRGAFAAPTIGAYIGAAYWFTSSTSFANPAVTIGRMFSNTFAGIAPSSVLGFIAMQIIGGAIGVALMIVLYPHSGSAADDVVVPHPVAD
jgi:glycerol uptake facilitator-like aquaporin